MTNERHYTLVSSLQQTGTISMSLAKGVGGGSGAAALDSSRRGGKINILNKKKWFYALNKFEVTKPNVRKFNTLLWFL